MDIQKVKHTDRSIHRQIRMQTNKYADKYVYTDSLIYTQVNTRAGRQTGSQIARHVTDGHVTDMRQT